MNTSFLEVPPVCDCCERKVKEKSSRPILLGCDAMLCKDCWYKWYDGGHDTVEQLKNAVWKQHGEFGSEANLTAIYIAREERSRNCVGENI